MENKTLDPYLELLRKSRIAKATRFQVNRRLERRQRVSYFLTSLLSLFIIILSLVPNVYILTSAAQQALLALTIMNSVFIIITTFMEASGNYTQKGEELHKSARKIATVYNDLVMLEEKYRSNSELLNNIDRRYKAAFDECPYNHEYIDYKYVRIRNFKYFADLIFSGISGKIKYGMKMVHFKIDENIWIFPHFLVISLTCYSIYKIIFDAALGVALPALK